MGRRGPKPLPTAVKAARGTLQKCRTNTSEPVLSAPSEFDPPKDLKGAGRAYWVANIRELVEKGVLRDADMPTFEARCRALTQVAVLQRQVAKVGMAGAIATGLNNALLKWLTMDKQLAAECGLSPSSRSGVKAVERKKPGTVESFLRAVK
jgi:phage terminase small subunit